MSKRFITYTLLFTLTFFVSCTPKKDTSTYFGGKIINPKSNYITLFSMDKTIDTLFLDADNKFLGKIENFNEGLYYFIHGNENQYIYLEPQDSLMIRLNTWSFDESIVFTGRGAERNNMLIDCFLDDENENKIFHQYNQLEPEDFKRKADSLISLKTRIYKDYIKHHPQETIGFKRVLKIALTFPIYSRIEKYPIAYSKYSKTKDFPTTNSNFYAYRNTVNINSDSLMYYHPYSKYVKNLLYNRTYSLGYKPMTNEYSADFTADLLNTINTNLQSSKHKNTFLKQTLIGHFYEKGNCTANEKVFDTFFKLSTNKEDKKQLQLLLNDSKSVNINKELDDFKLIDFNNETRLIKDIIHNKKACLFFWNSAYFSKSYIASRLRFLSKKHPEILFVIINFDTTNFNRIDGLDLKNQFFIDKKSAANNLLTSKMPRTILINNQGKVSNSFTSISSNNIFSELQKIK